MARPYHSFNRAEAQHAVDRLETAVSFEQEITLRPDEAYLILQVINRLMYNSRKRS